MHKNCPQHAWHRSVRYSYYLLTESMKLHWAFRQMQVVQRLVQKSKADEERCRKRRAVIKWCESCVDQGVWTL